MILEKAKLEEFEAYYRIKCEPFVNSWSRGDTERPPRENLYRFYRTCLESAGEGNHKEIYLIKTDEREIAGYLYLDYSGDRVDIPIALSERFTKRGLARQAVLEGLRIAKARGCRRSEIEIREDNAASIRMYTSCGYRRGEKTREMYAAPLNRTVALYAYGRDLEDVE